MKRLICLLSVLLFLCGCTRKNSFSFNRDSLNTSFHSKFNDVEYKGKITFNENNNMLLTITYPAALKGFLLYFNGESVASSFDGVENIHLSGDFPKDFIFLSVFKALKRAVTDGEFFKNAEKAYEMSCDGVTLVADENGNITSAKTENGYIIFTL